MPGIKRAHEDRSVLLERRHYQERPVVLEVQDPGNFRVRFKIVKDGGIDSDVGEAQHRCILMGIIPRRACSDAFAVEDDHPKHGYFITDFGNLWAQDGTDMESEIHNLPIDISLTLHFISEPTPTLIASTDDQLPCVLHFERPIPPDDYRPCVVFRTEDTAVEATVVETTKRPVVRGSPGGILAKMWEARSFADAELACDGKAFPAHREVLAAASPVFAATFGGSMKEAPAPGSTSGIRRRRPSRLCCAAFTLATWTPATPLRFCHWRTDTRWSASSGAAAS